MTRPMAALCTTLTIAPVSAAAQAAPLPAYLRDRGPGIPTSQFGTYVSKGAWLVFPFAAYTRDHNREYQPAKLGYGLNVDYRGKFHSTEQLVFLAYGATDWLVLEVEAAHIAANLEKSSDDPSAVPARIHETGIADFEGHVRARLLKEGAHRPEIVGFLELTPASHRNKALIKEPNWDVKPGVGLIRGFSWGTLQLRVSAEWNREAKSPDLGEVTVEYLTRLSPSFRINLALEGGETGSNDEWTVNAGGHWRVTRTLALKFDTAVGIMSKATDLETQIGLMFSLPR